LASIKESQRKRWSHGDKGVSMKPVVGFDMVQIKKTVGGHEKLLRGITMFSVPHPKR